MNSKDVASLTEVNCKKHGKCRVICISNRLAEYLCIGCWEERIVKAEAEGKRIGIFD